MTATEPGSNRYGPAPRQRVPGWVWGIGACACLPIAAVVALGLLAAPALKGIKESNRDAGRIKTCLANVKQTSASMLMYAQDYDDHLPPAATWMDATSTYADNGGTKEKQVFRCPTVLVANPAGFGYAYNTKLAGRPLAKIANTAQSQTLYDSTNLERNASDAVTSLPSPGRHRGRRFPPRRNSGFNIMGYADGHAKAVSDKGKAVTVQGLDSDQ